MFAALKASLALKIAAAAVGSATLGAVAIAGPEILPFVDADTGTSVEADLEVDGDVNLDTNVDTKVDADLSVDLGFDAGF
ncbi:MAG: hypothetical protein ACI867_000655 [Glaciecola sp.]|jgi:hypothetical protein